MKTVLIVADDDSWLFNKILRKRGGFATKQSADVEEIWRIATGREADIVLMDVGLSNSYYQGNPVNGIQITQLLKANSQTANLPVILAINFHEAIDFLRAGDRETLLDQSGADGVVIARPIYDAQEFVAQIKSFLLLQSLIMF